MTLRLLIDTDTASDDAVALLLAAADPDVTIEAVTVVAGNVGVGQGVVNALLTLERAGAAGVPVHPGCDRPLLRPVHTAQYVHGRDGMGDSGLAPAARTAESEHAVDAIIRLTAQAPGALTVVALGPLTNLAAALARDPGVATRIRHLYVMGGAADAVGNVSAVAEFNVWADPEAAEMVFRSGAPITMVGWDVSRRYAVMRADDDQRLAALDTDLARFVLRINASVKQFCAEVTHLDGWDLPDPITMAIALDPAIATSSELLGVTVDTSDGRTRGMTIMDRLGIDKVPPNVTVVWEANEALFKTRLLMACAPPEQGA